MTTSDPAADLTRVTTRTMQLARLGVVALVAAALWFASAILRHGSTGPVVHVTTDGSFVEHGEYPGAPLAFTPAPRTWGSWAGDDAHEGTLRTDSFPAPARLRLAISGYPHHPGNDLYLEMTGVGFRLPLDTGDVGERWVVKQFDLPFGWQGWPVQLVAVDHAHDLGGWLGVSEPLPPIPAEVPAGFGATLLSWVASGTLLGLLFVAAHRRLVGCAWLPPAWTALAAAAVVAIAGYLTFWAYFAGLRLGQAFALTVLLAATVDWICGGRGECRRNPETTSIIVLTLAAAAFYLALLHLFPANRSFSDLAANRFMTALPGDNRLPHDLAIRLAHGETLHHLSADWQSSDRPPLQSGWQLLTWPVTAALGFDSLTASGTAAMWLQLVWVAAAYGMLRTLGVSVRRAAAWTAVIATAGFFLQNTVFTWPKFSAAAFGCAAWAMWLRPARGEWPRQHAVLGAVFAALAWLSHGGVAFSFLALVPWLAWRAWRGEFQRWVIAAGMFALLALPWIAYQKLYDPPGDRLLKWHLAGQVDIDPRPLATTIRSAYAAHPWSELLANKLGNMAMQFDGDWASPFDFSPARAAARRSDEFYHTFRAANWFLLALVAVPLALAAPARRERFRAAAPRLGGLALWIAGTIVVWCGLMFQAHQAVIILGSYASMLALFVVLATALDIAGRGWLAIVAALEWSTLLTTWVGPSTVVAGPVKALAATLAVATGAVLVAFVLRGLMPPAASPTFSLSSARRQEDTATAT